MGECKFGEFFQDGDGRNSAARLNMTIGVLVGSFAVIWLTVQSNLGGEIFGTYMLATGGVYAWGKTRESMEKVEQTRADSPNPPPIVAPIIPPLGPTTTINVGAGKTEKVEDANITAQGDVTVKSAPKRKR